MTLALLLAGLLLQPPVQRPDAMQTPVPPATVKGHVVYTDGRPVVRATVRIVPVGRIPISKGTTTDEDGSYGFADIEPGRYRIVAGKPGFVSVGLRQRTLDEEPVVLDLKSGQDVEHVDITLPRRRTARPRTTTP